MRKVNPGVDGRPLVGSAYLGGVIMTEEEFAALVRDLEELEATLKTLPTLSALSKFRQREWPIARAIVTAK